MGDRRRQLDGLDARTLIALQRTAGNYALARAILARNPRRPRSDDETIRRAIRLFSATSESREPLGRRVLETLRTEHEEDDIGFDENAGAYAVTQHGLDAVLDYDIEVDPAVRRNVAMTAIRLVHEAIHQIDYGSYVREEMIARNLQLDFYAKLQAGVRTREGVYRIGSDSGLDRQQMYRERDQLLDFVVHLYADADDFMDAEWVANNINRWGGLANRWNYTKTRFLRALVEEPESHAQLIFRVLESEAHDRGRFRELVRGAGGRERVRQALEDELYSIESFNRLQHLQRTTGVRFGLQDTGAQL